MHKGHDLVITDVIFITLYILPEEDKTHGYAYKTQFAEMFPLVMAYNLLI